MIKISSKVDETVWNDLRALAGEADRHIFGVLTEGRGLVLALSRTT